MEKSDNNSLQQKTFSNKQKVISNNISKITPKSGSKLSKNPNGTHPKNNSVIHNMSMLKVINTVICIVWVVGFSLINYIVLYKVGYRTYSTMDWVYLIIMLLIGTFTGLICFLNKLKKGGGYILKYIVAGIWGMCGNFGGLLFSLTVGLIIYLVIQVIKWFTG